MRKHFLLLFFMAGLALSCTNDCLPMFDDGCDWQTSLSEIADDNKELFAGRGMELTGSCQMKDMKLDRELLCGSEYGSFPVYSEKDSVFTVLTYDELRKDAEKYNYDMEKVDARIDSILSHADDYDIIQLEWTGRAGKFYTLALFNRLTAELEYDNMLYNMSTVARYDSQELSMLVYTYEPHLVSKLITKRKVVEWVEGVATMARAAIEWDVYGAWVNPNPVLVYTDGVLDYYTITHEFTLEYLNIRQIYPYDYQEGYGNYVAYRDRSLTHEDHYTIYCALWAGPEGGLELDDYSILRDTYRFNGMIKSGTGGFSIIEDYKLKNDTLIIVPKAAQHLF